MQFPTSHSRPTSENRYWASFKQQSSIQHVAAIGSITFSEVAPHDLAICSSARVQIYAGSNQAPSKTLSRFKDVVHCVAFRQDGGLLAASTADRIVKVFDLATKSVLRMFKGHNDAVRVVRFDNQCPARVMSASDDGTMRLWDIPSSSCVKVLRGHTDFIRGLVQTKDGKWISASYDHSVRVWDGASGECILQMDQGAPCDAIVLLPGHDRVAVGAHNGLRILSIETGEVVAHLEIHQMAVTALCLDGTGTRLLSGSLDHHLKIVDLESMTVTHSVKFNAAIVAVGVSPCNTVVAVGMADGTLSIRTRSVPTDEAKSVAASPHGGTHRFFMRGSSYVPAPDEYRVVDTAPRRTKLKPHDVFLKKFQFSDALTSVLSTSNPVLVASVLDELSARDALRTALSGRDDESLEPVVRFVLERIGEPRFTAIAAECATCILDIYADAVALSPVVDALIRKLDRRVRDEVALCHNMNRLSGIVDLVINCAHTLPMQTT